MSDKKIQEQFGQEIIDAMARFAKKDIKAAADLELGEFSHVANADLRRALAETLYGARWLYKLGLALLANNKEQFAHVRAQIIDYASICEALLADVLVQARSKGKLTGPQSSWFDVKKKRKLVWDTSDPLKTVHATTFEWRIAVAEESSIIDRTLAAELNKIRTRRNTVHLTLKVMMGVSYYAGLAKRTHEAMHKLITQTKDWVKKNP